MPWDRPTAVAMVVVAIGAAVLGAALVWVMPSPTFAVLAIALPFAALAGLLLFGYTGSLLVAAAFSSFLLMNRIDEGLVINFGEVSLKASYWFVMVSALALFIVTFYYRVAGNVASPASRVFVRRFMLWFSGFVLVLVVGGVYNHLQSIGYLGRVPMGEVLASLSIVVPMLFVPLIVVAPYRRWHLVFTVQCIIALGGLAGLIMASFGFLPASLINALGWAAANQGTAGLLRGRLPLGHPNAVAAVIILLLPTAIVLGLVPGGRHFRMFYLGCAIFMFAGVLFSLARSALIVTTLILGLTVAYIYFGRGRKTITTYLLPAFFAIALVGVVTYLFLSFDFSRFWSRGYYEEATLERRNNSLFTSIEVFKDYPVFGVTPDALYTRLELRPGWEPPMQDNISPIFYYHSHMTAETPHNMYATVFAETGLLGAVCFFSMLGLIFRTLWQLRKRPHLSDEQRHALMGFMLGLLGFLLMGVFESLLFVGLRPAFLFWAMAGLALRYAFEIADERKPATDTAH